MNDPANNAITACTSTVRFLVFVVTIDPYTANISSGDQPPSSANALSSNLDVQPVPLLSSVPATRTRAELDGEGSSQSLDSLADSEPARKRQRTEHRTPSMRLSEPDQDSELSAPLAGPSSAKTNGFAHNGTNGLQLGNGNGVLPRHGKSPAIRRVNLPGTKLYDGFDIDREEFIRLVIQSLREVGYSESATTLEAESGYSMEAPEVSDFRQYILGGFWSKAEAALQRLGVHEEDLWDARFLINEQKYLELLESQKTTAALHVLRNDLAPLNVDPEQLHALSSLMMCAEPEDLRQRAGWDGAAGTSRRTLLSNLHRYIPASVMIPQHRFATLLSQAQHYQRQQCIYHNIPSTISSFSLYSDHQCDRATFPSITTTILEGHKDEVWNIEWSHDGTYLASASRDKSAIIWKIGPDIATSRDFLTLRDHPFPVGCIAWSTDDSVLLTSAENYIKLWNTTTGVCIRTIDDHSETVTALSWLSDGSGFVSAALDRTIIHWDPEGKRIESWGLTALRITDLAVTPDRSRLVAIGMDCTPSSGEPPPGPSRNSSSGENGANTNPTVPSNGDKFRMMVYDFATKQVLASIPMEGELTSVKTSRNSQFALISHAPHEIHLWDLSLGKLARKYTGQRQGHHIIRSCFGGIEDNFVVSGSEDRNVYIWDRETTAIIDVLSGHGEGSVNSVSWNPKNERMFASCSDDNTIRIWEPPSQFESSYDHLHAETPAGKGKGKTLQKWESEGGEAVSGASSTTRT